MLQQEPLRLKTRSPRRLGPSSNGRLRSISIADFAAKGSVEVDPKPGPLLQCPKCEARLLERLSRSRDLLEVSRAGYIDAQLR